MAEEKQPQTGAPAAKPAGLTRREEFAKAFGAAVLMRQSGRSPLALANEVVPMVDAFLEVLDKPTGKTGGGK